MCVDAGLGVELDLDMLGLERERSAGRPARGIGDALTPASSAF
jgi:hypothetical protein